MSVITSPEIDYGQRTYSHPDYRYLQYYPNTYGASISIGQSLTSVVFNLPPNEVFNFSKSYLTWTDSIVLANQCIWMQNDTLTEIQRIQYQPSNSTWIADIDYLQNYLQIVSKSDTSNTEFMTRDPYMEYMVPCNCRNINNVKVGASTAVPATPIASSGTQNYLEPSYLFSTLVLTDTYNYPRMFKLGDIKNSFFALDKSFYWGGQISYLRLYIGTANKFGYTGTDPTNPTIGSAVLTNIASMNNLTLYLAIEGNQLIRQDIINKCATSGLRYMIPYVQSYRNSYATSTSQQITIQFDLSLGKALKKIYHSIYNTDESSVFNYDHSNIDYSYNPVTTIPAVYGQKISSFYTILNGRRMQDITLNSLMSGSTTGSSNYGSYLVPTDYMSLRDKLKGSVISNDLVYQANWFWLDSFDGYSSIQMQEGAYELFSGIPMSAVALIWTFNGLTLTNRGYNHYTYGIFYRELLISSTLVTVN